MNWYGHFMGQRLLAVAMVSAAWLGRAATTPAPPQTATHFLGLTEFSVFTRSGGAKPGESIWLSPEIEAPLAWDELVVSWNAETPPGTGLKFEARALYPGRATKFYTLGWWSEDDTKAPRESVNGQRDEDGNVKTDTLVLKQPTARVQLRIMFHGLDAKAQPRLKFLGLSFLNSRVETKMQPAKRGAWGKIIEVPQRSQVPFGERQGWCSPTATSMVLAHWAKALKRSELDLSVPDVARGMFDKNWGGTGNWAFNTAFAGKFPGMRAYVARLNDVVDLEEWVLKGVPVVVSVSYDLLNDRPEKGDSGHLIVCVGFTKEGDVVVNDPWARLERGESVRKMFPRQNLIAAWKASHNTAYVIHPETLAASK